MGEKKHRTIEKFGSKRSFIFVAVLYVDECVGVFLGWKLLEHVYCLGEGAIERKGLNERKRRCCWQRNSVILRFWREDLWFLKVWLENINIWQASLKKFISWNVQTLKLPLRGSFHWLGSCPLGADNKWRFISPQLSILHGLSLSLTSSPSHKLLLCLLCSGLLTGLPASTLEPSVAPTFLQRSQDNVAQILSFPYFKSINDILLQLEKLPSPCEDLKWWSSPASISLSTSQL